jgi:hypothetical protein
LPNVISVDDLPAQPCDAQRTRPAVRQEAVATVEDVSAARDRAKAAVQNLTAEVDELRVAHVRSGCLPPTSTRGSRTVLNYGLVHCPSRAWADAAGTT